MNFTPGKTGRRGARFVAALTLGAAMLVSSLAWAVNEDDIINLHASGLSADVIVSVIRSSPGPIEMTEQDVQDLGAAGVPQPVLDELCLRIGCAEAPSPGGPAPGPGGPSLQQEIERQRQLEEQRRQLEMQRMEQERQRMLEQMEREQNRQAEVQQAFAGLQRARRLHREERYVQAAVVYNRFLQEVQPPEGSAEYFEGLMGFVRALHAAGYRHVIRYEALQLVLAGPTTDFFEEAFYILRDITNDAGYMSPSFEELTGFTVGNYDQSFQDDWRYFLGRFFWSFGEFGRAQQLLGQVSDDSENKPKAHYLSAVMYIDERQQRNAVQQLQLAVDAAERHEKAEVEELAYMALARIAYQVGGLDASLFYYGKVDDESPRHARALFETTWAYFLKQDFNRAIGRIHSLQSPYYNAYFYPELRVIEAAAYLYTCHLDEAELALSAFDREVRALQEPVQQFISETTTPNEFWDAIHSFYRLWGTPNEVQLPIAAVRHVLKDEEYMRQYEILQQLQDEQTLLIRDAELLGQYGSSAQAAIDADIQAKIVEGGLTVATLIREFNDELTDWGVKAQEVGIEITTELLSRTDAALEGVELTRDAGTTVFVLAQDWQYWPFEGEYWLDEVDNYRANLPSMRDEQTGTCLAMEPLE